MSWKKWLVLDVLVAFLALTAWVVVARGAAMVRDLWSLTGLLLAVDLTIALTLAVVWLWRDARAGRQSAAVRGPDAAHRLGRAAALHVAPASRR
ncbi:MAG TPA: hypothetical protein VGV61_19585 [Thermoanaerobaculia bacterium]|jgi:hypothetical protein|nr:hypothetical protein [Thermoanaerobaculia bacterium]